MISINFLLVLYVCTEDWWFSIWNMHTRSMNFLMVNHIGHDIGFFLSFEIYFVEIEWKETSHLFLKNVRQEIRESIVEKILPLKNRKKHIRNSSYTFQKAYYNWDIYFLRYFFEIKMLKNGIYELILQEWNSWSHSLSSHSFLSVWIPMQTLILLSAKVNETIVEFNF